MPPLSPQHLLWLLVTTLFVAGCIGMQRPTLFVTVVLNETAWFLYRHYVVVVPLAHNLPLHLCDISVGLMLMTLATDMNRLRELSYVAGTTGAIFAVSVPVISESSDIRVVAEIRYLLTHIALVGVGFYFTFGRKFHPGPMVVVRAYIAAHLYALVITPLNMALDTNYFFTLRAPNVDFLQQHPHWLFLTAASFAFLLCFGMMYVPFALLRTRTGVGEG